MKRDLMTLPLDLGAELIIDNFVDIGMRMLSPRELACAQGFPESYVLDLAHNGKRLSKAAQVRMIDNSVCPPLTKALIEANFAHEREIARGA